MYRTITKDGTLNHYSRKGMYWKIFVVAISPTSVIGKMLEYYFQESMPTSRAT